MKVLYVISCVFFLLSCVYRMYENNHDLIFHTSITPHPFIVAMTANDAILLVEPSVARVWLVHVYLCE